MPRVVAVYVDASLIDFAVFALQISPYEFVRIVSPDYSLEGLMLKLRIQYIDHLR